MKINHEGPKNMKISSALFSLARVLRGNFLMWSACRLATPGKDEKDTRAQALLRR
jgi:hypothetical protein